MRRLFRVVTLVTSTLLGGGLAAGLSAVPVGADSGPVASTGCSGTQCWSQLGIQWSGNGYQGGGKAANTGFTPDAVPPPACWYGDPMTGAAMYAMEKYDDQNASGIDVVESLPPAGQVKAHMGEASLSAGAWYEATGDVNNPGTSACVAKLAAQDGVFIWIPAGGNPPQPEVTPLELAEYAYSQMTLPSPDPVVNPDKTTFVTLPTFVKSNPRLPKIGPVQITATLGGVTATVTATPTGLTVSAPGSTSYGNGPGGKCLPNGSTASQQTMDKASAGATPDCGVVFQSPSSGPIVISASEGWTATSTAGPLPQQPGATTGTSKPVQVNEIQSVTGPGSNG